MDDQGCDRVASGWRSRGSLANDAGCARYALLGVGEGTGANGLDRLGRGDAGSAGGGRGVAGWTLDGVDLDAASSRRMRDRAWPRGGTQAGRAPAGATPSGGREDRPDVPPATGRPLPSRLLARAR